MAAYKEFELRYLRYSEGLHCPHCQEHNLSQVVSKGAYDLVLDSVCSSKTCNQDPAGPLSLFRRLQSGTLVGNEPFILNLHEPCDTCGVAEQIQFLREGRLVASECQNDRCGVVRMPQKIYLFPMPERAHAETTRTAELIPDKDVHSEDPEQESA